MGTSTSTIRTGSAGLYSAWRAYSQSKLANMLFALELQRRLTATGAATFVTAAHPGYTATDLQRTSGIARLLNPLFGMKPADGALPTLRAAADPDAAAGSYWGPSGLFGLSGPPEAARIAAAAKDPTTAAHLWTLSETMTGVSFPLPGITEASRAADSHH